MLTKIGMTGALVDISQSPFDVPDAFIDQPECVDRIPRARRALEALGDTKETRKEWKRASKDNAAVGTVLWRIDPDVSARLLHHAYVLAMINLHVVLAYPILDIPSRESFQEMVR